MKEHAQQAAQKCIFCGAGNLSKEHFWPAWASALLPRYPINQYVERFSTYTRKVELFRPPKTRNKPGHAWTKKIRVVCETCNNGWMSAIETAAKPVLTPLILSTPHKISNASILIISQWVTLKVLVGEHSQIGDAVASNEDREKFRSSLTIPENFRIWIARCGVGGWETAYYRYAATVSLSPNVKPEHKFKNIHTIAFGIGDLLVYVFHTSVNELELDFNIEHQHLAIPIFPVASFTDWPPVRTLMAHEASYLAHGIEGLFKSSKVIWRSISE